MLNTTLLPKRSLSDILRQPFDVDFAKAEDNECLLRRFYSRKGDKLTLHTRDYAYDKFWYHSNICTSELIDKYGEDSQWYIL